MDHISPDNRTGQVSRVSTGAVGRYLGLGLLLVGAVTLITFVFSFLGTILCGAVVGMMTGASRKWRWSLLLVSLVFPGAMMASLRISKSEGVWTDSLGLPLVCFAIFWATYLLTLGLLHLEKRPEPLPARPAPAKPEGAADEHVRGPATTAPSSEAAEAPAEPGLDELQGTWVQEATAPDGRPCQKIIEVAEGRVVLSLSDFSGRTRLLCQGKAKLERAGPFRILRVADPQPTPPGLAAGASVRPQTWLYRVVGPRLALVSNLEAAAADGAPALEIFVRSQTQAAK